MSEPAAIPDHGRSPAELLSAIDALAAGDIDWRGGRAFSLVYNVDDDEHEQLLAEVAGRFLHDNALNPFKYPSLLQMELDLIAMACGLFGTAPDAGALTSGGTESIFLAVQVARDHARSQRGIAEPRLVTPTTAHPAFAKAAKYLDVEHVLVPVAADGRADVAATAAAIDDRTGLVVGSAPCYPFGVIDPIEELAALAMDRGVLFHTDACLGGWLLPWWERLGDAVPAWDFRVPGVTSLSADVHKYGYSFKGASIVAYRSRDLLRHQHFWYDDWPGGLYASGTSAGTRPAPPIAGAWAAVNHLGVDGYLRLTSVVRDTARKIRSGVAGIDGIAASGDDALGLPIMEIRADRPDVEPRIDMAGVGDVMDLRGWNLDRQQGGLHLMLSPYHARIADRFLADLADAVAEHSASAALARYGGIAGEGGAG